MRSAYGLNDRIEKLGSQESLVSKNLDLWVQGMGVVIVVIYQPPHDVDLKGASRTLLTRKTRNTN